jgi:hypothetical protein
LAAAHALPIKRLVLTAPDYSAPSPSSEEEVAAWAAGLWRNGAAAVAEAVIAHNGAPATAQRPVPEWDKAPAVKTLVFGEGEFASDWTVVALPGPSPLETHTDLWVTRVREFLDLEESAAPTPPEL